jgi:hypothetical protein
MVSNDRRSTLLVSCSSVLSVDGCLDRTSEDRLAVDGGH